MNTTGHYVGAEGTSMQRRRIVVAVILYWGLIVMLWLLPAMARKSLHPLRPFGRAWLEPARIVAWKVANAVGAPGAARDAAVKGIGSVCVLGVLGLPFLGAFLSRSSNARIALLILGAVIGIIYVLLVILSFALAGFHLG